jgi:RNA-binding protein
MTASNPLALSSRERQHLKAIGHSLNPIVTVADNGLSGNVLTEIERALRDHELIKVKFAIADREEKRAMVNELCQQCRCALVQQIGHLALVYRPNPDAHPGLSNLKRQRST